MEKIKKAATYKEQIEILKRKGVIVADEEQAKLFLSNVSYYTLKGYLFNFRSSETENAYIPGLTFEKVYNIYQCDKRVKNILMYAIEIIEHSLKTKIAYILAHAAGEQSHLDPNNFKNEQTHQRFVKELEKVVQYNQKIPFVKHHIEKYKGNFPIWVASELFTLGMIQKFYNNLITPFQKAVAKEYGFSVLHMKSWIKSVAYLRNLAAHYMRLYKFSIQQTPKTFRESKFTTPSYKIFDIIFIMQFLIMDKNEWNYYILPTFEQIFDRFSDDISLSDYGFAENWKELLKI